MLIMLALLSWGWPPERTEFIGHRDIRTDVAYATKGWRLVRLNECCGSMLPVIRGGEFAYVEDYRGQPLHEGEIVADRTRTHRIVALSKTGVRLAGDANRRSDPWQPRKNIQYIIRVIVRHEK